MTITTPGRAGAARACGRIASAFSVAAGCALAACGPGVATPIPEPPTLNFERIGPPEQLTVMETATPDGGRHIYGLSGAAPPGSQLRVTNLDRVDPAVFSNVRPDGGFDLNIVVNQGDELRFDWTRGGQRGAPRDARFIVDPSFYHFEPASRFACLKFTPDLALDFSEATEQSLQAQNECDFELSLASPRTRLGSADFTLQTPLPLVIPGHAATELRVLFARAQPGVREDTLFMDVTANAQVIRYPVTLLAPSQP